MPKQLQQRDAATIPQGDFRPFRPLNNSPSQRHLTHCDLLCFFLFYCITLLRLVNTKCPPDRASDPVVIVRGADMLCRRPKGFVSVRHGVGLSDRLQQFQVI